MSFVDQIAYIFSMLSKNIFVNAERNLQIDFCMIKTFLMFVSAKIKISFEIILPLKNGFKADRSGELLE